MPVPASMPGKAHKAGWSPARPYVTPDDPMPRDSSGLRANVVSEKTPERAIQPVGELHASPSVIANQSPVPRASSSEPLGDGQRVGQQPRNPQGRFVKGNAFPAPLQRR